jgi:hypothetical protein
MWSESGGQVVEFDLGHQGISDCIRNDILIWLCHIWITPLNTINGGETKAVMWLQLCLDETV